jgi:exodeoxyribonuclease V alpha subunit
MLDKLTFSMLLDAINPAAKVVLIGDDNQLNPVNSNSILEEIRLSGSRCVSFCNLSKNYRSGDKIIDTANTVLSGNGSTLSFEPLDINEIYKLKESGYQIIANSNSMVEKINTYFSKTKNDVTATAFYNYNFGDDVLICRNNSSKGLYNGDVATLDRVERDKLVFKKDNSEYTYDVFKGSRDFQPADCITVHKSQGSEYDKVVLVLDDKNFLLNKNILYTAITRAKSDIRLFYKSGVDLSLLDVPQVSGDSYTLANIPTPDRPL